MAQPESKPADERRKRLWKALGGIAAFVLIGMVLTPGISRREPTPAPDPHAPPGSAARTPRVDPSVMDEASAWIGDPLALTPGSPLADGEPRAFDCIIGPSEVVDVGSPITGLLDEIPVERSDFVEAGQVVAQLEASVEQAAVSVARAQAERTDDIEASRTSLALSEKRVTRARELFERDALSLDRRQEVEAQAELAGLELARAREDHRLAKLQLDQARASLERRTIRTPVAGVVIERLLSPGEVVDEETVVRIAKIDPLRVEAILPADWFGRMQAGDLADVVPEAPLDQARSGRIVIVDPVLDAASGTFSVQLDLPNPDRGLPAGLRCQVRFSPDPLRSEVARGEAPTSLDGNVWQPSATGPPTDR